MLRSLRGLSKVLVRGSGFRLSFCERQLQERQLFMSLQSPEALGGLLHGGTRPAQRHRWRAPVFDVAADAPHRAHHILDDVRAGERAPQFSWQSEISNRSEACIS